VRHEGVLSPACRHQLLKAGERKSPETLVLD
jgi:hypothetical protein